ncbi:MAG: MFS transporter [Finegoldia magna]|nr:MFS transporter [Finegoldia magna]
MNEKFKKFMVVWFGQFVSMLGSGISSFGLSLWIFMMTKSATTFAMTFLVQILPGIIFAPFAGSMADRKQRKHIIVLTDSLDAVLKVILMILLATGSMKVWMVYPLTFLSQTLGTFQNPAFNATIPLLVEKKDIPRANGFMQLIRAIQNMLAPLIAGALFSFIGLTGLFAIDFVTFFVAILTILPQKIEQEIEEVKESNFTKTIVSDLKIAIEVLKQKQGFIQIIVVFSILNFVANIAMVLGGVISGAIPSEKNKVRSIFLSLIICSIGLIVMGINYSWIVIAVGFFLFMIPTPYANGTLGSLMQLKIETKMLGRVGSLVDCLMKIVTPIAIILAGFLADNVFNPLLVKGGKLSDTFIGKIIGVGNGRGIGLLFVICGTILLIICVSMLLNKNINQLEELNPDVIND